MRQGVIHFPSSAFLFILTQTPCCSHFLHTFPPEILSEESKCHDNENRDPVMNLWQRVRQVPEQKQADSSRIGTVKPLNAKRQHFLFFLFSPQRKECDIFFN